MLQPLISDSLREFTWTGVVGTLDQLLEIKVWTSSLGGHDGITFFGPRKTAADSGRED